MTVQNTKARWQHQYPMTLRTTNRDYVIGTVEKIILSKESNKKCVKIHAKSSAGRFLSSKSVMRYGMRTVPMIIWLI